MSARLFVALALLLVMVIPSAEAQVPRTLSYQGVLTDSTGRPKPDGSYSFTFRLYPLSSGGSVLWTETKTLTVGRGLFSTVLGDQAPLGLPFDTRYWLGVQVAADPELAPRVALTSAGYSLFSIKSDTARYAISAPLQSAVDSARIAGTVANNAITSQKIADSTITGADVNRSAALNIASLKANAGAGRAVEGNSGSGTGVYGYTMAGRDGVSGQTDAANGNGVLGISNNGTLAVGVGGVSSSGYGVAGVGGPYGVSGNGTTAGVSGVASTTNSDGVYGESSGPGGNGVRGYANNNTSAYGVWGQSTVGYAVVCSGRFLQGGGTFSASPTSTNWTTNKPATVKLNDGAQVKLFAEEAAEIYFNDYGEATLRGGRTRVDLDPKFLQTVTIDAQHPMKVFVQLEGDCKGVYVTNKTATGFEVVELQGGMSNAHFTYRVVCKRKYYEDERLATEEQDIQYNTRMLETVWPEVIARQRADEARGRHNATEDKQPLQEEKKMKAFEAPREEGR